MLLNFQGKIRFFVYLWYRMITTSYHICLLHASQRASDPVFMLLCTSCNGVQTMTTPNANGQQQHHMCLLHASQRASDSVFVLLCTSCSGTQTITIVNANGPYHNVNALRIARDRY